MRTLTLLVAVVTTMIVPGKNAIAAEGQQQPQYSQFHKPMAPIGPTSAAQCDALEAEWSALCTRITNTHQQCLDASTNPNIKGAGACSKAPCLSLHIQMDECNGAERQQAVAACRASVKQHTDRQAELRRLWEGDARAQEQRARERRERQKAETDRLNLEADRQRQVAEAYRRSMTGPKRTEMSDHQAATLSVLQQRAEAAARENRRSVSLPRDHDFVGNNTMPELTEAAALIEKLGERLGRLDVEKGAEIAQWFTEIHDARRAAAENARVELNDSLRRDFPNEKTFNFDKCLGDDPSGNCRQFSMGVSAESREKWQQYEWAMSHYFSWTDLGNISGRGWTKAEQAKFMSNVGGSTMKQVTKWLEEEQKQNPSWGKPPQNPFQDDLNDALKERINKHLDNALAPRPRPSPMPVVPPAASLWSEKEMSELTKFYNDYNDELRRRANQRENQRFLEELARELPTVQIILPEIPAVPPPPAAVLPRR